MFPISFDDTHHVRGHIQGLYFQQTNQRWSY